MYSIAYFMSSSHKYLYMKKKKKKTWNVLSPMAFGLNDISSHINQGMQVIGRDGLHTFLTLRYSLHEMVSQYSNQCT
jgi:hypothetical protein